MQGGQSQAEYGSLTELKGQRLKISEKEEAGICRAEYRKGRDHTQEELQKSWRSPRLLLKTLSHTYIGWDSARLSKKWLGYCELNNFQNSHRIGDVRVEHSYLSTRIKVVLLTQVKNKPWKGQERNLTACQNKVQYAERKTMSITQKCQMQKIQHLTKHF